VQAGLGQFDEVEDCGGEVYFVACAVELVEFVLCCVPASSQYGSRFGAGGDVGGSRVSALRPVQPILRRFSFTMNSSLWGSTRPSGTIITFNADGKDDKLVTKILPFGVSS
jgi:hypothetical protein